MKRFFLEPYKEPYQERLSGAFKGQNGENRTNHPRKENN